MSWRDDSMFNSTHCSSRGSEVSSHLHPLAHNHELQLLEVLWLYKHLHSCRSCCLLCWKLLSAIQKTGHKRGQKEGKGEKIPSFWHTIAIALQTHNHWPAQDCPCQQPVIDRVGFMGPYFSLLNYQLLKCNRRNGSLCFITGASRLLVVPAVWLTYPPK